MKIELDKSNIETAQVVSANKFKMNVLAETISINESVKKLLGMNEYREKIQILDHQVNTALRVINNFPHRALLSDEVGLGKTIEAGMIIKEYLSRKFSKKVLILTPATLAYQWQEEMRSKFNEEFHIPTDPQDFENYDKIIVSIDTAKTERNSKIIRSIYWDLIVIDEAHKLKNKETQNYKFVKKIQKERCLMLTATPLQNNIFELWALTDLLHPGFFGTLANFTKSYVEDDNGLKIKNHHELQEKLGKIMIRNLRRDVNIEFVDRNISTLFLNYTEKEMRFYTEAVAFIKRRYQEIKKLEELKDKKKEELTQEELKSMAEKYKQKGLLTFRLIMLTRQITSSTRAAVVALKKYLETIENDSDSLMCEHLINLGTEIEQDIKIKELMKILNKEKKSKNKVIIFTSFLETQKYLQTELAINGFSTVLFNGSMNAKEKEAAVQEFKEEKQVLICTDSGSEGRNLQFSHILINYDLPWNPMRVEQRIGRVHRIGQTRDVEIYNLAINDTIESYILNRLYEKINLFQVSVGEMDLILSQLKSKKSFENRIFDAIVDENDDGIENDLLEANQTSDQIKELDHNIFDKK